MPKVNISDTALNAFAVMARSQGTTLRQMIESFASSEAVLRMKRKQYKNKNRELPFPDTTDFLSAKGQIWVRFTRLASATGWSNNTTYYTKAYKDLCKARGHFSKITTPGAMSKAVGRNPYMIDAEEGIAFFLYSISRSRVPRTPNHERVKTHMETILTAIQMLQIAMGKEYFQELEHCEQVLALEKLLEHSTMLQVAQQYPIPYISPPKSEFDLVDPYKNPDDGEFDPYPNGNAPVEESKPPPKPLFTDEQIQQMINYNGEPPKY